MYTSSTYINMKAEVTFWHKLSKKSSCKTLQDKKATSWSWISPWSRRNLCVGKVRIRSEISIDQLCVLNNKTGLTVFQPSETLCQLRQQLRHGIAVLYLTTLQTHVFLQHTHMTHKPWCLPTFKIVNLILQVYDIVCKHNQVFFRHLLCGMPDCGKSWRCNTPMV